MYVLLSGLLLISWSVASWPFYTILRRSLKYVASNPGSFSVISWLLNFQWEKSGKGWLIITTEPCYCSFNSLLSNWLSSYRSYSDIREKLPSDWLLSKDENWIHMSLCSSAADFQMKRERKLTELRPNSMFTITIILHLLWLYSELDENVKMHRLHPLLPRTPTPTSATPLKKILMEGHSTNTLKTHVSSEGKENQKKNLQHYTEWHNLTNWP